MMRPQSNGARKLFNSEWICLIRLLDKVYEHLTTKLLSIREREREMSLISRRNQFYYQSNQLNNSSNSLDSSHHPYQSQYSRDTNPKIVNRSRSVTFKDGSALHDHHQIINHRNRNLSLTERTTRVVEFPQHSTHQTQHHYQQDYYQNKENQSECLKELDSNQTPINTNTHLKRHRRKSRSDLQLKSNSNSISPNSHANPSITSSPPASITPSSNNLATIQFPIRLDTRTELISILDSILGSHRLSTLVNLDHLRNEPNDTPTISPSSNPTSPQLSVQSPTPSATDTSQSKGLFKRLGWRTRAITLASIRPSTATTSKLTEDPPSSQRDSIKSFRLFGAPLSETACASCVTIIGGQKHRLPILVFKTVEEIYTRGLGIPGLFRTKGNPLRIESLIKAFETSPSYGDLVALDREGVFDLCDLLRNFLWSLPQPLLEPDLGELFWTTCVDEDGPEKLPIATRVTIAQVIFRLLPTRSFSLLVYLIAFLSQIPLSPGNQLSLPMISQIFGPALLAPRKVGIVGLGIDGHSALLESNMPKEISRRAVNGLAWLQSNWNQITDGLLDERIRYPPPQASLPSVPTSPRALTIVEEASFECDSEGQAETEVEKIISSDKKTESQPEIETESTIVALQPRKANDSSRSLSVSSSAKKPLDPRPTSCSQSLIDYPQSTARMSCGNLSHHLDPSLSTMSDSQKTIDPPRSLSASSATKKHSNPRPISTSQSLFNYTQSKASSSLSDVLHHPEACSSSIPEHRETLALPRSVSTSSVPKLSETTRLFSPQSLIEDFGKTESSPALASHLRRDSETSNASITLSSASVLSTLLTPIQGNLSRSRQERFPSMVLEAETEPIFVTSPPAIHTSQSTAPTSFGSSLSNAQSIVDQYEAHGPEQLRKIIDSFKAQDHRERRVSTCTSRCESCSSVLPGDLKRYSIGATWTASDSPKLCSCPINIRPRIPISTRTKRTIPTLSTRKTTQAVKRIGVAEEDSSEEDSDPLLALSEMMRSKNGMIRAQAETIKAQAELLVESENRLAAQTAHSRTEELDEYFIPLLKSIESLNKENRKRIENELIRLRFTWEMERKDYEEEKVKIKEKLLNTLQDYEKVCDQLSVIRRAIGEEPNHSHDNGNGQSSSSSSSL
ncbi:uncharacterized protein MELLADRAFT_117644 [Melampsora larici-populina 98AG31]|uniref:Rho-GAP domain-containing protein n=1 Tax=Melampsora larici-populina (strain 98AG31 / pathotype 3-4-7) TaxID=747676 RepID=F4RZX9_MELLP|nr:uncharacterized protein MELLADRAFT_117644 [Melampsora larici-populina 98AG31]EGG02080.1 hypothetical protein MELLADRAFT_117644 [Melampsora larici-populina 98AG31]